MLIGIIQIYEISEQKKKEIESQQRKYDILYK